MNRDGPAIFVCGVMLGLVVGTMLWGAMFASPAIYIRVSRQAWKRMAAGEVVAELREQPDKTTRWVFIDAKTREEIDP